MVKKQCHRRLNDIAFVGFSSKPITGCQCRLTAGHKSKCLTKGHHGRFVEWETLQEGEYIAVVSHFPPEKEAQARDDLEGHMKKKAAE